MAYDLKRIATDMTFEQWYAIQYDVWWKDHEVDLRKAWRLMSSSGASDVNISAAFSVVAHAIKDQYGD